MKFVAQLSQLSRLSQLFRRPALFVAALSVLSTETRAQVGVFPPWTTLFHFYSLASGQCMQPYEYDADTSMLNLPTLQQPCVGFAPRTGGNIGDPGFTQAWMIYSSTNMNVPGLGNVLAYRFMNWGTGLCLDLRDGNTADGAYVQQYRCNNSNTEFWSVRQRLDGYFELILARRIVSTASNN